MGEGEIAKTLDTGLGRFIFSRLKNAALKTATRDLTG